MELGPPETEGGGKKDDEMEDGMQCRYHPFRNRNNPGGICAFCLQEKLGKLLVSSSFPVAVGPSTSSSSSSPPTTTSFTSQNLSLPSSAAAAATSTQTHRPNDNPNRNHSYSDYCSSLRKPRIPFLLAKKKKKKKSDVVFKRSKSTAAPPAPAHFFDKDQFTPRKHGGGFWSFMYHSTSSNSNKKKIDGEEMVVVVEEEEEEEDDDSSSSRLGNSQATASASSFERRVSRSRSVGCGSRSFSGDFFERISSVGFGDCKLRRVESQREKPTTSAERVKKCGGLFGGFIISSSSSSSSSSSYWVSDVTGKSTANNINNGRTNNKSWSWGFASPIRAFSFSSKTCGGKRDHHVIRETGNTNSAPNLPPIPSLLTVRS